MYLATAQADSSGATAFYVVVGIVLVAIAAVTFVKLRRTTTVAGQEGELRQLVQRYEQLAATTLDAQQRFAADVSELRSRTSSIEQLLRTVE